MSVGENVKYKQGMSLSTEQSDRAGAAFGPVTRGVIRYVDGIRSTSGAGQKPLRSVLSSGTTGMPVRFERRTRLFMATETVPEPEAVAVDVPEDAEEENGKRSFLKLAGIAGAGVAASMLLPSKAEALVFGSTPASNVVGLKNASNARIDPATEGGNLAGIKTNTDPLVTAAGGGYVRQDSTGTIAKETGGNLADIKTNTDVFAASAGGGYVRQDSTGTIAKESGGNLDAIKANTDKFTFDGSGNLLTAGGAAASAVEINDTTGTPINPAQDESLVLLRRMVKLMESQATVDNANRQRVSIDAGTLPTVSAVTAITNALPAGANVIGGVTNVATLAGQNQQMYQDVARNTYANGLRQNLIFS